MQSRGKPARYEIKPVRKNTGPPEFKSGAGQSENHKKRSTDNVPQESAELKTPSKPFKRRRFNVPQVMFHGIIHDSIDHSQNA
jgi:hypothetical protein